MADSRLEEVDTPLLTVLFLSSDTPTDDASDILEVKDVETYKAECFYSLGW